MKKNKGFTLIELLVVIAIALSIVGLSVLSVVNISKSKKEDAYKKVVEQIEDASKNYVSSNEYLIHDAMGPDDKMIISVGKLVDMDYLNVVVDPRDNKEISYCSYVEVTKNSNGIYKYSFVRNDDNSKGCDGGKYIVIEEAGAPSIDITTSGKAKIKNSKIVSAYNVSDYTGWYTSNVKINVKVNTEGNGKIVETKYCKDSIYCVPNNDISATYTYTDTDDGSFVFSVSATNVSGKKVVKYVTYKKDSTNPTVNIKTTTNNFPSVSDIGWFTTKNENINYSMALSDSTSGLLKVVEHWNAGNKTNTTSEWSGTSYTGGGKSSKNLSGKSSTYTAKISVDGIRRVKYQLCDVAGNCTYSSEYLAKMDRVIPTCKITPTYASGKKGNGDWYLSNVTLTLKSDDAISGVNSRKINNGSYTVSLTSDQDIKTYNGVVYDNAGNSNNCSIKVGIEKSATIVFNKNATNNDGLSCNPGEVSNNQTVFNTSKTNVCKFGTCTDIKAHDGNPTTAAAVDSTYFARSCMYVNDFYRYFDVTAQSVNSGAKTTIRTYNSEAHETSHTGQTVENMIRESTVQQTKDSFTNDYNINYQNLTGMVSAAKDIYQYTTPAGNKTNKVALYAEYRGNCGYYYK